MYRKSGINLKLRGRRRKSSGGVGGGVGGGARRMNGSGDGRMMIFIVNI